MFLSCTCCFCQRSYTMEYILLIHSNENKPATDRQWAEFFIAARESGMFAGGSEISRGELLGAKNTGLLSERPVGHMRFDTGPTDAGPVNPGESDEEEKDKLLNKLYDLLKIHPTVLQGGTVELCEMPKTK